MRTFPILSICIPTYNRELWCLETLESIFNQSDLEDVEICISINYSNNNYTKVLDFLILNENRCKIKYIKHEQLISIDKNHHFVIKMATSDYIYLLGDDDIMLPDSVSQLKNLISNFKPDLAIFNGNKINNNGKYIGTHFDLSSKVYNNIGIAFQDLRDKGTFGSVLIKKIFFNDSIFKLFYGTQHAYGTFWLTLFEQDKKGIPINIIIPKFKCVSLRFADKTYNHIGIYYKDIPIWFKLMIENTPEGTYKKLISDYEIYFYRQIKSYNFLKNLSSKNNKLDDIKFTNTEIYNTIFLKIKFISLVKKIKNFYVNK